MSEEIILPPYDDKTEAAAIGCLMNGMIDAAQADYGIQPEMFYLMANQIICQTIFTKHEKVKALDATLIFGALKDLDLLDEVGGMSHIQECMDAAPIQQMAGSYFERVKDLYLKRQTLKVCYEVQGDLQKTDESGMDYLKAVPQKFFDIMPSRTETRTNRECMDASRQLWADVEAGVKDIPGLPTGFAQLDEALGGGLMPGFHVIGARPSAGKTSLEGCIMTHLAKQGVPVARVCMDMDMQQLLNRDICRESSVSLPKLNLGYAGKSGSNMGAVDEAIEEIDGWPMHILEREYDIDRICSWIRVMKARHDIQVVSLDYIQLCTASTSKVYMSDVQRIGHCSHRLKELGQELKIPILVLAQLNRDLTKDGRMPQLSDLKGCGDLEQHAQTCILLSKEVKFDYKVADVDEVKQRAIWMDLAKNQQGGIGKVEVWFRTHYFKMEFADEDWGYPEAV